MGSYGLDMSLRGEKFTRLVRALSGSTDAHFDPSQFGPSKRAVQCAT
jgi:hypothetical protein